MASPHKITDRAKRYRAQANVTGPRKCVICGTRNGGRLDVMHLTGNEDHGEKENLAYGCRSCNTALGVAFKKVGAGRPTVQYNPAKKGVPTFAQYLWAVSSGQREYYANSTRHAAGVHDEAGAIIHATPKHKRIEYARRIAKKAGSTRKQKSEDRWNPGTRRNSPGSAAEGYELFHGQASREQIEVVDDLHVHENLWALGDLERIKVKAPDGAIVTLSGFDGAFLCAPSSAIRGKNDFRGAKWPQMLIRGGDQTVDLEAFGIDEPYHEVEDLGEVREVRYFTTKQHLGKDGGTATYFHHLGEEDKAAGRKPRRPRLLYHVRDGLLSFAGGGYSIPSEGIRN